MFRVVNSSVILNIILNVLLIILSIKYGVLGFWGFGVLGLGFRV
jgi:hypothetical protein